MNSSFTQLFGSRINATEGQGFTPLFSSLTDAATRLNFPSKDDDIYVISKEGNITNSLLSSILNESMREQKEFNAVLYDKNLKTITCKVIVLPTSSREVGIKDPDTVHFGVCIQKLFTQDVHQNSHESQRSHELDVIQSLKYADILVKKQDKMTQKIAHNYFTQGSESPWVFSSPLEFPLKLANEIYVDDFINDHVDALSITLHV
jgi:hypothetical protein